jgi:hypothetical protein
VRPGSDDRWASYRRTVVEIAWPAAGRLWVRSAPEPDPATWPWPTEHPVHILTAWDPGSERPGEEANRARQASLQADLQRLALPFVLAVGVDPATGRREEGVAVRDAAEAAMVDLAASYGQDGLFGWTPQEWAIVGCGDGRRLTSGWSIVQAEPGFPYSPAPGEPI